MVQITQGEFWGELISTQLHKMVELWNSVVHPVQTGGDHKGIEKMPKVNAMLRKFDDSQPISNRVFFRAASLILFVFET